MLVAGLRSGTASGTLILIGGQDGEALTEPRWKTTSEDTACRRRLWQLTPPLRDLAAARSSSSCGQSAAKPSSSATEPARPAAPETDTAQASTGGDVSRVRGTSRVREGKTLPGIKYIINIRS